MFLVLLLYNILEIATVHVTLLLYSELFAVTKFFLMYHLFSQRCRSFRPTVRMTDTGNHVCIYKRSNKNS